MGPTFGVIDGQIRGLSGAGQNKVQGEKAFSEK